MKTITFVPLAVLLGGLLTTLPSCTKEPEILRDGPATHGREQSVAVTDLLATDWTQADTLHVGTEQVILAPIADHPNTFSDKGYRGYRFRVVATQPGRPRQEGIVELLAKGQVQTPAQVRTLLGQLYIQVRSGTTTIPIQNFTGYVFLYTKDYYYRTGRAYVHGLASANTRYLLVSPRSKTPKYDDQRVSKQCFVDPIASITPPQQTPCTDYFDGITGDYITTGGDCGGSNDSPPPPPPHNPMPTGSTGPYTGTGYGGNGSSGGSGPSGALSLIKALKYDQMALFSPCPGLTDAWRPLISYLPPLIVTDRLSNLTSQERDAILLLAPHEPVNIPGSNWQIQSIRNASGVAINLDYFSVTVTRLPAQFRTPEALLNNMRLNFNNYINQSLSYLEPNLLLAGEGTRWASQNPLGSIISIRIPGNSGSVIVSGYDNNHWIFSTIHDPLNGSHPVSGNREFGFTVLGNGSYNFYIRGADRIDSRFAELLGSVTTPPVPFLVADALWESWQSGFAAAINRDGGQTIINSPITNRPEWNSVLAALQANRPLATVGCN